MTPSAVQFSIGPAYLSSTLLSLSNGTQYNYMEVPLIESLFWLQIGSVAIGLVSMIFFFNEYNRLQDPPGKL